MPYNMYFVAILLSIIFAVRTVEDNKTTDNLPMRNRSSPLHNESDVVRDAIHADDMIRSTNISSTFSNITDIGRVLAVYKFPRRMSRYRGDILSLMMAKNKAILIGNVETEPSTPNDDVSRPHKSLVCDRCTPINNVSRLDNKSLVCNQCTPINNESVPDNKSMACEQCTPFDNVSRSDNKSLVCGQSRPDDESLYEQCTPINAVPRPYNKLLRKLFNNYTRNTSSVDRDLENINVSINILFTYFRITEKFKAIELHGFVTMSWIDQLLKWKKSDGIIIESVESTHFDIWEPDLISHEGSMLQYHYNKMDTFRGRRIKISRNGTILFNSKITLNGHCTTNLKDWPFDRVRCSVVVGISILNLNRITLNHITDRSSLLVEDRTWRVLKITSKTKTYFECENNPLKCPRNYIIVLKRKSSVYESTFIFPQMCISVLCLFTFRIAKGTVYRLTLFVAILLSQVMYLFWLVCVLAVKKSQETSIRLFEFYAAISWIATFGIIQTLLNRYMLSERNQSLPPSFMIDLMDKIYENRYMQKRRSVYVIYATNVDEVTLDPCQDLEILDINLEEGKNDNGKQWKRLGDTCDTILFGVTLFCIIYHFSFILINWI